ncbi:TetR/AcrR family transcriptional regulator [Sporolactobacillus vineae]|uniref:TetR/AcrR family transcriptional regulator n=1 Tax=Sporolactobacillus vineae TaxID=444463 RepID=UPI0002889FA3|nr:TetR/AcrR family transcriptional regulator [Sporolactobacillus vineae]
MKEKITKQAILSVSRDIVNQEGYDALTLARVAKALKIKTPSLYNHISGLKDLRKELALDALKQLNYEVTQSAVGRSGDGALKAIGFAFIHFMRENPGLYAATLIAPDLQDPDIDQESSAIVAIIIKVLEPYHFGNVRAIHFVRGLRALAHGFSTLEYQGGFQIEVPLDDSISVAFDTFIKGLMAMNEAPGKENQKTENHSA